MTKMMIPCPGEGCENGKVSVIDNGPPGISTDAWIASYPNEKQEDCSVCDGAGEIEIEPEDEIVKILKISTEGSVLLELPGVPLFSELQEMIGGEGKEAYIETVFGRFPDPDLIILCDEDGRMKGLPCTAQIKTGQCAGESYVGTILVVSRLRDDDGWGFCGLSEDDVATAQEHLEIAFNSAEHRNS